jgi:hypothetical protein
MDYDEQIFAKYRLVPPPPSTDASQEMDMLMRQAAEALWGAIDANSDFYDPWPASKSSCLEGFLAAIEIMWRAGLLNVHALQSVQRAYLKG